MKKVLLTIGLWIGLLGSVHAMSASDIISRARIYLKDQQTSANRQQFSDTTLMQFISDGQREANSFAWLLQKRATYTLTANTTEYALPSDFMTTNRVLFQKTGSTSWIKLDQTSFNQLDADSAGWMGLSAGTPNKYYVYLTTSPVIGFVPAPATLSTGTVQVDYIGNTTDIASTSDTPFNGYTILVPFHPSLIYYTTCRAYMVLEETDLAQPYCDQWNQWMVAMKSGLMKQPDFNPGMGGRRNQ